MRIRVRSSRRRVERITLNLASMIDVTFLLLIYFMVTMVFAEQEDHLSPSLQTQRRDGASEEVDFEPQRIDVMMEDGVPLYRLGARVMRDRASLAEALAPLPRSVGVFIRVRDGVPVGFAVTALQVAHDTGFEQVTYVPWTTNCAAPLAALALAVGLGAAGPVRADEVAAWLERHGLLDLLAVHLEARAEAMTGEDREELVIRLSDLYARLLSEVQTTDERLEIEERSRRLLASAPDNATQGLQLALLRATYRSVERLAENHRLRTTSAEELDWAKRALEELIPDLGRLRQATGERMEALNRRLSRASGTTAVLLAEESERVRELEAETTFLNAWALYYQSWLNARPDNARVAQRLFVELLDLGDQPAIPESVSEDLRSTEAIARCVLGTALCRALTSSTATALDWLALLEHENAHPALRAEVPIWRIVILLEDEEWREARAAFEDVLSSGAAPPIHWLRLVAAHAMEGQERSRAAAELARLAVTRIAARGELAQVLDLAERYGVDAMGRSGFPLQYVRGILEYHAVRETHGREEPTTDATLAGRYAAAIELFEAARDESDAADHPEAAADALRLIAWCRYFRGELGAARRDFEAAAALLPPEASADALWMAIVCLDRLASTGSAGPALDAELAELMDRFLVRHPSSEHAPRLLVRRAMARERPEPEDVDELLSVPERSPVHLDARRQAALMLYRLFRDASGRDRAVHGQRHLAVAMPLLEGEEVRWADLDPVSRQRAVARARRLLEVALSEEVARPAAARAVLAMLVRIPDGDRGLVESVRREIDHRRVQERLRADDPAAAASHADAIFERAPGDPWSRRASRAVYRDARRRWETAGDRVGDDVLRRVVRFGARVLAEIGNEPTRLEEPGFLSCAASVAEATAELWRRGGDAAQGRDALERLDALLAVRPRNARFLRLTAGVAAELGERDRALYCWRTLLAGSDPASEAWYEAKFNVITLLAALDPARARAVMDQHRRLDPAYGPPPWGARLRALDGRLPPPAPGDGP